MRKRTMTSMYAAAVCLALLTAPALADWSSSDSGTFLLNLLTLPADNTGAWADSGVFGLNLYPVNRASADSGTFTFSDAPSPSPDPLAIECPIAAAPNAAFNLRVTLRNNGGPGAHGGISISVPILTGTDDNMPPYDSAVADVAVHAESTFAGIGFYDKGDTIYDSQQQSMVALYLLVEGDQDGWDNAEARTLTLTVTPKQVGPMTILVRGWIAGPGSGYGPPVYRWPDQDGSGREQDQQGCWTEAVCVGVAAPTMPGSVEAIGAAAIHAAGVDGLGVKMGILGSAEPGESGLPWTGHPAMQTNLLNGDSDQQHASDHETEVAGVMVGVDPVANIAPQGWAYRGVVPESKLASEQVSSLLPWDNIDNAMLNLRNAGCLVINYSGGFDPTHPLGGTLVPEINRTIDDMIDDDKITVVCAAGNASQNGSDPDTIPCPANAYNVIAVGTLGALENGGSRTSGPWNTTSAENIPGPTAGLYAAGRCKPDLVAPGDCTVPSTANPYVNDGTGSSLAAPHVAGAAALLMEAARAAGAYFVEAGGKVDPRVIKSALLTAANKAVVTKPGVRPNPAWHTDGPSQPLDQHLGAGGLDVLEAKRVMLGENEENVARHMAFDTITWAEQSLTLSIGQVDGGSTLVASLVWNAHICSVTADVSDLDLYLLKDGVPVAWSRSTIDNVEHLYQTNLAEGNYALRIDYAGHVLTSQEKFALSYRIIAPVIRKGDMDCNGAVNTADIALFVEALLDPAAFDLAHPNCTSSQADMDHSDTVDGSDIQAFVNLLLAP